MTLTPLLGLLEPISIAVLLVVFGLLSKRLGEQMSAKPYYLGFYTAAALMLISAAAGLIALLAPAAFAASAALPILLEDGLPAAAVTIGIYAAWRYWSWLLAERD